VADVRHRRSPKRPKIRAEVVHEPTTADPTRGYELAFRWLRGRQSRFVDPRALGPLAATEEQDVSVLLRSFIRVETADGVAESPDRFIDFDAEMYPNLTRVIETQDAVLLGRRT
jgi:hypothetical protein